jgi:hypothetical protein
MLFSALLGGTKKDSGNQSGQGVSQLKFEPNTSQERCRYDDTACGVVSQGVKRWSCGVHICGRVAVITTILLFS